MKKSFVYILAAAVAIALAVGLFLRFGTSQQADPVPDEPVESSEPVVMVDVLVAAIDIPADTEVTASMLESKSIPLSDRPFFAVTNVYDAVGNITNININAGDIIQSSMVEKQKRYIAETEGLSYEIPEGFVGLAIPAESLRGMAGYLLPGDVINILADAKAVKAAVDGIPFLEDDIVPNSQAYLVKNVTIIAVGDAAYDEAQANSAVVTQEEVDDGLLKRDKAEDEETGETVDYGYGCVIIALDDPTARIVTEVMKSSDLTFTLQHRSKGIHDVTKPELVQVGIDFLYETEKEYKDNN